MLQYTEVRFDRAGMRATAEAYMEAQIHADPKHFAESAKVLGDFLTEDYVNRDGDWPRLRNKDLWVKFCHNYTPKLIKKVYYKKPDGYMIVDNRRGMIAILARQELYNAENVLISTCYQNINIRMVKCSDGKLRIDREMRSIVPGMLSHDLMQVGEGSPCWLYSDLYNNF